MNMTQIGSVIGCSLILAIGIIVGILMATIIIPQTEKIVVTEKIVPVEIVKEVEIFRFIDEDYPVHKWIDPDNQAVVYIYPEGYTGEIMPMYSFVSPIWFNQLLQIILSMNGGTMPPEIINSIPKEWLEAVAPSSGLIKDSGLSN